MRKWIRLLGLLGIVWAVGMGVLGHLVGSGPNLGFFGTVGLLLLASWRLYNLRRWAAVVICVFCALTAITSPQSGIWIWTCGWIVATLIAMGLVRVAWRELRAGF